MRLRLAYGIALAAGSEVALYGKGPPHSEYWVENWLGVYSSSPRMLQGRSVWVKRGDPEKLLWFTEHGYWHFGHTHDISSGAGMIATKDSAATPDAVRAQWHTVTGNPQARFEPAVMLHCISAPLPNQLWLSGHGPKLSMAPWLTSWTGAYYQLTDAELVNGWPSYGRSHDCLEPRCDEQALWFALASDGTPHWMIGHSSSSLGDAKGLLSLNGTLALDLQTGQQQWRVSARVSTHTSWLPALATPGEATIDDSGNNASDGWVIAPHLRLTDKVEDWRGYMGSLANATQWPRRVCLVADALDAFVHHVRSAYFPAKRHARKMAVWWHDTLLGASHVLAERLGLEELMPTHGSACSDDEAFCFTAEESARMLAVCLAGLFTWVALACVERFRKSRWWWGSAVEEEDDDEEEEDEPESSEEKRLAFACLVEAIEDVKGKITEQEYLALYNAGQWCFNLTPHWAGTLPTPPPPAPADEMVAAVPATLAAAPPSTAEEGDGETSASGVLEGSTDGGNAATGSGRKRRKRRSQAASSNGTVDPVVGDEQ